MTKIPISLIYLRFCLGLLIILVTTLQIANYKIVAITLLTIGLLTDIADGIIARRLAVSTQKLRRLDSTVDQVFFASVVLATYTQCPEFFRENISQISVLIGIECLAYLVSYIKFKKEIATHSIGAKIWTLLLFATLVQLLYQCQSTILFQICFWIGIATRLEIIAIILILKQWTNDVPNLFYALKLRQGKEIKRNKLFNG